MAEREPLDDAPGNASVLLSAGVSWQFIFRQDDTKVSPQITERVYLREHKKMGNCKVEQPIYINYGRDKYCHVFYFHFFSYLIFAHASFVLWVHIK